MGLRTDRKARLRETEIKELLCVRFLLLFQPL